MNMSQEAVVFAGPFECFHVSLGEGKSIKRLYIQLPVPLNLYRARLGASLGSGKGFLASSRSCMVHSQSQRHCEQANTGATIWLTGFSVFTDLARTRSPPSSKQ